MRWKSCVRLFLFIILSIFAIERSFAQANPVATQNSSTASTPASVDANSSTAPNNTQKIQKISYNQIKALKQSGKLEEAKSLALAYLKDHPQDVDVQLLLGSIYYQQKNYLSAQEVLQRGLNAYPTYMDVRVLL